MKGTEKQIAYAEKIVSKQIEKMELQKKVFTEEEVDRYIEDYKLLVSKFANASYVINYCNIECSSIFGKNSILQNMQSNRMQKYEVSREAIAEILAKAIEEKCSSMGFSYDYVTIANNAVSRMYSEKKKAIN